MDEEDGRTGPRARKFGPPDVLTDATAGSLRNHQSILQFRAKFSAIHRSHYHLDSNPCIAALLFGRGPAGARPAGEGEAV
jgi:hypothetical protein